jgi:co-chaperonin GroES (HSP10)
MQPKILSIRKAEYINAPYFGKNESGCTPLGDRVLVRPDIAAAKVGELHIPDDIRDRAQLSGSTGVVIELGEDAFRWNFDRSRPWTGYRPVAGDRIYFDRYAGKEILGKDGQTYRLMDDKCIGGVEKAEETQC